MNINKSEKEVDFEINQLLGKIRNLNNIDLYICTENNGCGCLVVGLSAYDVYMNDGHGCHYDERSLELEEILKGEKVFKNPKISLKEKNNKFDELYSKYGVSESRLYKSGDYDGTINENCLKIKNKKFGQIWEKTDEVLNYHFRNLKDKPKIGFQAKKDYLKYLKKKCQGFLDREVWVGLSGIPYIIDNWVVNDGWTSYDGDDQFKMNSFCSTANDFIENYF